MQRDDSLRINGRADEQVEFGGYRVDLARVRSALAAVAGVDQAVVIAREDRPGDRRLVGYITGTADSTTTQVALAEQRWTPGPLTRLHDRFVSRLRSRGTDSSLPR